MAKKLTLKQQRFAKAFASHGNGTQAAREAGYRDGAGVRVTAHRVLTDPNVKSAVELELAKISRDFSPERVRRRLDRLSHGAEAAGQFGPATRCEELLGKAAGMWIDLQLKGEIKDEHIMALLQAAKRRQIEPIDLADDVDPHTQHTHDDDEDG